MTSENDVELVSTLRRRGAAAMEHARRLFLSEKWCLVNKSTREELHSCVEPGFGRLFKVTAYYDSSPSRLKKILIDCFETYPKWTSIYVQDSCKRVMVLGDDMDITHAVTHPRLGGLVAARDWLTLRAWSDNHADEDGAREIISTGEAVQLGSLPPGRGCVRAETILGAYSITDAPPSPSGAPRTCFQFVTAVRLGGWLPRSITERYVTDGIVDFTYQLRRRLNQPDP